MAGFSSILSYGFYKIADPGDKIAGWQWIFVSLLPLILTASLSNSGPIIDYVWNYNMCAGSPRIFRCRWVVSILSLRTDSLSDLISCIVP